MAMAMASVALRSPLSRARSQHSDVEYKVTSSLLANKVSNQCQQHDWNDVTIVMFPNTFKERPSNFMACAVALFQTNISGTTV